MHYNMTAARTINKKCTDFLDGIFSHPDRQNFYFDTRVPIVAHIRIRGSTARRRKASSQHGGYLFVQDKQVFLGIDACPPAELPQVLAYLVHNLRSTRSTAHGQNARLASCPPWIEHQHHLTQGLLPDSPRASDHTTIKPPGY